MEAWKPIFPESQLIWTDIQISLWTLLPACHTFMKLPRAQAIAFFTHYQDRLIYGTDDTYYSDADAQQLVRSAENTYARDWRFLATNSTLSSHGIQAQGLALPDSILRKIYHENAVHWFPGLK